MVATPGQHQTGRPRATDTDFRVLDQRHHRRPTDQDVASGNANAAYPLVNAAYFGSPLTHPGIPLKLSRPPAYYGRCLRTRL
jgi:hypothetical protein